MSRYRIRPVIADDWRHLRAAQQQVSEQDPDAHIRLGADAKDPLETWQTVAKDLASGTMPTDFKRPADEYLAAIALTATEECIGVSVVRMPAHTDGRAELRALWVSEKYRGKLPDEQPHVADALLYGMFDAAWAMGAGSLELAVSTTQRAAVFKYDRLGFALTQFPDDDRMIRMRRDLTPSRNAVRPD